MIRCMHRVIYAALVLLATSACSALDQATESMEEGYHFSLGAHYFQLHRFQQALAEFDAALEIDPAGPSLLEYRGATYVNLGNARAGIADLTKAKSLLPKSSTSAVRGQQVYIDAYRGGAYMELGDYPNAERDFIELTRLSPRYTEGYINLAEAFFHQRKVAAAIAATDHAIALYPRAGMLYNNRCFYTAATPKLSAALADCDRALALDKTPYGRLHTLSSRAVVDLELQQPQRAIADCDAALKLAPRDADSLYLRGLAERTIGNTKDANRDIADALATKPALRTEYAVFRLAD
jgi:tetratricopeptide (TPR) repeat protein